MPASAAPINGDNAGGIPITADALLRAAAIALSSASLGGDALRLRQIPL